MAQDHAATAGGIYSENGRFRAVPQEAHGRKPMNRFERVLLVATILLAGSTLYFMQDLRTQRSRGQASPTPSVVTGTLPPAVTRPAGLPVMPAGLAPARAPVEDDATRPATTTDPGKRAVAQLHFQRWQDPQHRAEQAQTAERSLRQFLGGGVEMMGSIIVPGMELPEAEIERVIGPLLQQAMIDRERQLECDSRADCDVAALEAALDRDRELQLVLLLGAGKMEQYKARVEAFERASASR